MVAGTTVASESGRTTVIVGKGGDIARSLATRMIDGTVAGTTVIGDETSTGEI